MNFVCRANVESNEKMYKFFLQYRIQLFTNLLTSVIWGCWFMVDKLLLVKWPILARCRTHSTNDWCHVYSDSPSRARAACFIKMLWLTWPMNMRCCISFLSHSSVSSLRINGWLTKLPQKNTYLHLFFKLACRIWAIWTTSVAITVASACARSSRLKSPINVAVAKSQAKRDRWTGA